MTKPYVYFVEGECEKKFIDIYKVKPHNLFQPGQVFVFNFINKYITLDRISLLNRNATIILVYDTDEEDVTKLEANLKMLKDHGFTSILHIQSIYTFEDELVYATSMKNINELCNSESNNEFKNRFLNLKRENVTTKLKKYNFDGDLIWNRQTKDLPFSKYYSHNHQQMIKQKKK